MALNLGKIENIGAKLSLRCTSGTGQLLRISVHEFQEKVMGYNLVCQNILDSIHYKL